MDNRLGQSLVKQPAAGANHGGGVSRSQRKRHAGRDVVVVVERRLPVVARAGHQRDGGPDFDLVLEEEIRIVHGEVDIGLALVDSEHGRDAGVEQFERREFKRAAEVGAIGCAMGPGLALPAEAQHMRPADICGGVLQLQLVRALRRKRLIGAAFEGAAHDDLRLTRRAALVIGPSFEADADVVRKGRREQRVGLQMDTVLRLHGVDCQCGQAPTPEPVFDSPAKS